MPDDKKRKKESLKIRLGCTKCLHFSGTRPEDAACAKKNVPTCYRKKKACTDFAIKPVQKPAEDAIAYVDGSYNGATGEYGAGALLCIGDKKYEITESAPDIYFGRQIQGEILAAEKACRMAIERGCKRIEIRYDYMGVEMWPTGKWHAYKPYTETYAKSMRRMMREIGVSFRHVKSHSGNAGNEKADDLAKEACGLIAVSPGGHDSGRRPKQKPAPCAGTGINPTCKAAIERFYKDSVYHTFSDFMKLRTYGLDAYSMMSGMELEAYATEHDLAEDLAELNTPRTKKEYHSAIRWIMRGLRPDDAVHKAKVDAEVSENCQKSKKREDGWRHGHY